MKHFLLIVVACMQSHLLPAQKLTTDTLAGTSSLYDTYIKKSQRKSKAAHTLKYTAIGSAVTSGIFFLIATRKSKSNSDEMFAGLGEGVAGFGLGIIAVGSGLTSLFLSASSRKYKKASLNLSPTVKIQTLPLPGTRSRQQLTGSVVLLF